MSKAIDLSVHMGDITFKNPFIVGAGPTVKTVDQITAAEDNGWAGVSFKLAIDPFPYINWPPRYRWLRKEKIHIFTAETRLKTEQALKLLEQARRTHDRRERTRLCRQVQAILHRDQPFTFLFYPAGTAAVSRSLRGVKACPRGFLLFWPGPSAWWVAEEED